MYVVKSRLRLIRVEFDYLALELVKSNSVLHSIFHRLHRTVVPLVTKGLPSILELFSY